MGYENKLLEVEAIGGSVGLPMVMVRIRIYSVSLDCLFIRVTRIREWRRATLLSYLQKPIPGHSRRFPGSPVYIFSPQSFVAEASP